MVPLNLTLSSASAKFIIILSVNTLQNIYMYIKITINNGLLS